MTYTIVIDSRAIRDIQEAISYYDLQNPGLGEKFEFTLHKHFLTLEKNPYFRIRYDNVHCLPMKKFPFMLHHTVDEEKQLIIIQAVFHTALDPKNWKK